MVLGCSMIKSILLILVVCFSLQNASANNSSKAMLQLFSDNFEGVLNSYEMSGGQKEHSGLNLLIAAKAYENLGEYDQAASIYKEMIGRYSSYDEAVRRSLRNPELAPDLEEGNILAYVYYLMAKVYVESYLATSEIDSKEEREDLKNKVKIFALLSERANGPIVAIDELRFKVSEKEEAFRVKTYKTEYYAFLGFMTWQDKLKLEDGSGNVDILNTSEGSCAGFGVKTFNVNRLYGFDMCYLVGSSTASSLFNNVTYEDSGVSTSGFFATFETAWQVFSDNLWIGPSVPVFYRKGDWRRPADYEFRETSYIRTGLLLSTTWDAGQFSFTSRFGKIFDNKSSHLQIHASYRF